MEKHFAVKTKDGATFMTKSEIKKAKEGFILETKVPVLIVRKTSPSTNYNRVSISLIKDNWQWGIERYYELYHLKRQDGLLLQLFREIQNLQDWGYDVKFEGFLEKEE